MNLQIRPSGCNIRAGILDRFEALIIQEDPAEVIELVRQVRMNPTRASTTIDHRYATRYFLQRELDSARANDLKASTPETRRRVRDLEEKLEQIRRRLDGEQR